jgi:hypothetical protein
VSVVEIPLKPTNQTMGIVLGGAAYGLRLIWNTIAQVWVMDVSDPNGKPVANGIALVTGTDILEQLQHLGFGGAEIVLTDHDHDAVPTFANLGVTSHLYFVT